MRLFRLHQQLQIDDHQLLRRHQLLRLRRHQRVINRKNLLILHYFLVGVIRVEYFLLLLHILGRVLDRSHLRQIHQRYRAQQVLLRQLRLKLK